MEDLSANDRNTELNIVEIFMAERGKLRRIIAGMGLSTTDIEDVLQDVSVRALKQPMNFQIRQEVVRWLIRVTINQCLIEHRRRKRFKKRIKEILLGKSRNYTNSAENNLIVAEELEIVRDSLKKLNNDLLGPVVLRYFCDMDSKEIGETLQQKPSTIRSRLREARIILAKGLLKRGIER